MMQQHSSTPVIPIEKYCFCNITNDQSDAEVILPDNSRYCMLCGHKKKANVPRVIDINSFTKPQDDTADMLCGRKKKANMPRVIDIDSFTKPQDDPADDDDDVVIVKEEKRHGVPKRKRDSDLKDSEVINVQNNQKTRTKDNTVKVIKIAMKPTGAVNLVDKQNIILNSSTGLATPENSSPKINLKRNLASASTKETHRLNISKDIVDVDAGNIEAKVTKDSPKIQVIRISTSQSEIDSRQQTKRSKAVAGKPKIVTPIIAVREKVTDNKTAKIKNKQINLSEVRKSKRAKKATSRFNDCVTLNLDTVSESSESTDSADETSDDNSDDDGYASPLDMLDEENICKVCMSYEPPIEFEMGCDVASFELKWIDCDSCHRWFHWFCVGIFDENDTNFFKCKPCRMQSA